MCHRRHQSRYSLRKCLREWQPKRPWRLGSLHKCRQSSTHLVLAWGLRWRSRPRWSNEGVSVCEEGNN